MKQITLHGHIHTVSINFFFIIRLLRKKKSFERISLVPKYGTYSALDLLFRDLASLGHGSAVTIFRKNFLLKEFRLCLNMEPILL